MKRRTKALPVGVALVALISSGGCSQHAATDQPAAAKSPASIEPSSSVKSNEATMVAVRFLEERVKGDPDDLVALNKLAAYYLQLHRETDDVKYLKLSLGAAQASLKILPIDQNLGGLTALALAEFETHNFTGARDHAKELTEYKPQSGLGLQLFGDASLELGDYDSAAEAYRRMERLNPGTVGTETRLAHFELLRGDVVEARRRYELALDLAAKESIPSAETIAWCHWQLGELEFGSGNTDAAEAHYQKALSVFSNYPHAISSLARLRVARGDLSGAISLYESVVTRQPDPADCAALSDVYELTGRVEDAQKQRSIVERIGSMDALSATIYKRHLILFWADHNLKPQQAYLSATEEYAVRRDVYAADALAWSALKAGRVAEARSAMNEALRLGTKDARLFYHAGMIERAAGDTAASQNYLRQSLKLNPNFDPLQSIIAKKALDQ